MTLWLVSVIDAAARCCSRSSSVWHRTLDRRSTRGPRWLTGRSISSIGDCHASQLARLWRPNNAACVAWPHRLRTHFDRCAGFPSDGSSKLRCSCYHERQLLYCKRGSTCTAAEHGMPALESCALEQQPGAVGRGLKHQRRICGHASAGVLCA